MTFKAYAVHYRNKFPGGKVDFTEDKLDAYDSEGNHRVALRVAGNGQIVDVGSEVGASDQHCLSPIPKNARVYKLEKNGCIGMDEKASERKEVAKKLLVGGKILSIEQYREMGVDFDQQGNASVPKRASAEDLGSL